MSSVDCVNPNDTAADCLDLIRKELGWYVAVIISNCIKIIQSL